MSSLVIVGGGQAAGTLASVLRSHGFDGPITIATAEKHPPYERPPLSKGVLRGDDLTPVVPGDFYAENDIEVRLGFTALRVEDRPSGPAVIADDGSVLSADRVVLATGARARSLRIDGADLANVVTLRDAGDATRVRDMLPSVRDVVIVGAGFVGTEVAAALVGEGREVVIIEPMTAPLANRLGEWAAARLFALHAEAGVSVIADGLARIEGHELATAVLTTSGRRIPCDLLVIAVGSEPRLEVAEASGISCDEGVVCDGFGRTSMAGVYAAGDIASWPYGAMGRARVEHFRSAVDHAQVIAAHLLGDDSPRALVPSFWTDQYAHRFEIAGWPQRGTEQVVRFADDGEPVLSFHLDGGRLVGAVGFDRPRELRGASHLIGSGDSVDPAVLADPSIDVRKAVISQ